MRTARRTAVLLAALTLGVGVAQAAPAGATAGALGSCDPTLVTYADGSADLTNLVDYNVGDQNWLAGCVTVHSVPGVSLSFVDAITYPGWTYRVKDAGGRKLKVSVEFTNPAAPYKITYVIQPGRIDWKLS